MIFDHATVVTVDAERRIVRDGAIAVSGTRIAGVGPREEILRRFPDDPELTDLRGMVVLPGLVNTHVHQSQALIRGCADDRALVEWLIERVWPLQGNYTPEDARTSAELCLLELLRSGTTAFIETMLAGRYGFDGIVEAVASCGIRAALSRIVMDISTYAEEEVGSMHPGMIEGGQESFDDALELHDRSLPRGDRRGPRARDGDHYAPRRGPPGRGIHPQPVRDVARGVRGQPGHGRPPGGAGALRAPGRPGHRGARRDGDARQPQPGLQREARVGHRADPGHARRGREREPGNRRRAEQQLLRPALGHAARVLPPQGSRRPDRDT